MLSTRCFAPFVLPFVLLSTGCLGLPSDRKSGFFETYNPLGLISTTNRDKIVIRSVLVEQPLGEAYLTSGVWNETLSPVPPEKVALLAENGLRVGTFPSNPPGELLNRITQDDGTIRPTEGTVSVGDSKLIPINGPVPMTSFRTQADIGAEAVPFELPSAEFAFTVTPTLGETGKLKLLFEPRVQHGAKQGWLRPLADGTGFSWLDAKPQERFSKLAFEVTVTPGELLIIGSTESAAGKLGGATFVTTVAGANRQRLLVVRAWKGPEPRTSGPTAPGRKLPATVAAQASGR